MTKEKAEVIPILVDPDETDVILKAVNLEKADVVLTIMDPEEDKAVVNHKYFGKDDVSFTHAGKSLAAVDSQKDVTTVVLSTMAECSPNKTLDSDNSTVLARYK